MDKRAQKTFKLNPATLSNLDALTGATGSTMTAVIEMAVAFLYREMFGADALLRNAHQAQPDTQISSDIRVKDLELSVAEGREITEKSPGERLKARRIELGLNRVQLAKAAGISEGSVRRYENDAYQSHAVTPEFVAKLALGLQWTPQRTAEMLGAVHLVNIVT